MDPRGQQNRRMFFSDQNESLLLGLLAKNFSQRQGAQLNERQVARLSNGLEFFMNEVIQANPSAPVQLLNKEVIQATAADFNMYLQREQVAANTTPDMLVEPAQRFERLQQERQRTLEGPPRQIPDYVQRVPIEEDNSVSAMELFEEAKKKRNFETAAQAERELAKRSQASNQPFFQRPEVPDAKALFATPLDLVVAGTAPAAQREPPGRGDANPTIARPLPGTPDAPRGTLQQDVIIKQQDIQTYKETEYNLSVFSADRTWERDNGENRYNFSVNLFSGNPTNGASIMPKGTARFRNIVRIEFVKAILPVEGLEVNIRRFTKTTYDTASLNTVYSYPFVLLNVDELDTNNYGTNDAQDRAFGLLQYDANWIGESTFLTDVSGTLQTGNRGFTGFIPKHMKCQRVYTPTPLAALTKLTIQLQRPDGNILSTVPDTLDVSGIFFSYQAIASSYFPAGTTTTTLYKDSSPASNYIWINAKTWFSRFAFAVGDRIRFRGLSAAFPSPTAAQQDFLNFMQREEGHLIAQIVTQTGTGAGTVVTDGLNSVGYARFIVIENQYNDPTTGSTTIKPFGGATDNTTLGTSLLTKSFLPGRLINLSHQTQLIFRVITRDYDSTSLVRPDNL
jgi:hypothetical protein